MGEIVITRDCQQAGGGQTFAIDPIPSWHFCTQWSGEITIEPGDGGPKREIRVGIQPPGGGGIVLFGLEVTSRLHIEAGFLLVKMSGEIDLGVFRDLAGLNTDETPDDVGVWAAGRILCRQKSFRLTSGELSRFPQSFANKGEPGILGKGSWSR